MMMCFSKQLARHSLRASSTVISVASLTRVPRYIPQYGVSQDRVFSVTYRFPLSMPCRLSSGYSVSPKPRKAYTHLRSSTREHQRNGEEIAFAWITPRALTKGLEGGILARLLSLPSLRLVGARMYQPNDDFLDEYIETHQELGDNFRPYVKFLHSLRPDHDDERGYPSHLFMLLFVGPNARSIIADAIGMDLPDPRTRGLGKTIRGTYGYFRRALDKAEDDVDEYEFEPAIIGAKSPELNERYLKIFAKYADSDGGVLIEKDHWHETGMVMIKPDALSRPSSHVGHIMDLFSSTGLHLVGAKLFSFSVDGATDFYGFLKKVFAKKLSTQVEDTLRSRLSNAFNFELSDSEFEVMTCLLKEKNAVSEVNSIIHYMSGIYPHPNMTEAERARRGPARCLALIYRGPDAINTIRAKLGDTNPDAAAHGTIRSDYGHDVMRNAAHASDSLESLERERHLIGLLKTRGEHILRTEHPGYRSPDVANIINVWYEEEGR